MNKRQPDEIKKLKATLKTIPCDTVRQVSEKSGINPLEIEMLVDKFCFKKSNLSLSIKYCIDDKTVSEIINCNLNKICIHIAQSKELYSMF